jgi:hypothetical protein
MVKPMEGYKMGTKRVGLARVEALIENLKRDLAVSDASLSALKGLAGAVAATVTAAAVGGTAAALETALICPVDSGDNGHGVKLPLATYAGQICIIVNVDDAQDCVIRNNADAASLATVGEGKIAICIATATGDNWKAGTTA